MQTCIYEVTESALLFFFLNFLGKMLNALSLIKCSIVQASDCADRSKVPMAVAMMPIDKFTVCKPSPPYRS